MIQFHSHSYALDQEDPFVIGVRLTASSSVLIYHGKVCLLYFEPNEMLWLENELFVVPTLVGKGS